MAQRVYLILHGVDGSGPGHWQHWLTEQLRAQGEQVVFPDFPDASAPKRDQWLPVLEAELSKLAGRELIVLAHSIGVMMWLHHAKRSELAPVLAERVMLVAPTSPYFWESRSEGFLPMDLDGVDLSKVARSTQMVSSDNDEYCPPEDFREMEAKLGIVCEVIPGGAHLNSPAGYGEWPAMEAWALGKASKVAS